MNEVLIKSANSYFNSPYFVEAQRGMDAYFQQDISQIAWDVLSRGLLHLYNVCDFIRAPYSICSLLPFAGSPLFRSVLIVVTYAMDHFFSHMSLPIKNSTQIPEYPIVIAYNEEIVATITTAFGFISRNIPDHHFNIYAQKRMLTSFAVLNLVAHFHKQYDQSSKKITRLFFNSVSLESDTKAKELLLHPHLNLLAREKSFQATPLHFAATYGQPYLSDLLQKYLPPFNYVDAKNSTPLHYACIAQRADSVTALLNTPHIEVNEQNAYQDTPLHYAVLSNCLDCIKALSKNKNINWNLKNAKLITPFEVAVLKDHQKIVEFLLKIKAVQVDTSALVMAAIDEEKLELLEIYQKNPRFNFSLMIDPVRGETILHYAIGMRKLKAAFYLTKTASINFSVQNTEGLTAYDLAIKHNDTSLAEEILHKSKLSSTLKASHLCKAPIDSSQNKDIYNFLESLTQTLACMGLEDKDCSSLVEKTNQESDHLILKLASTNTRPQEAQPLIVELVPKKSSSANI